MRSRARRALSISLGTWLFEAVSAPSAPAARRRAAYVVASLLMLNLRSHGEQVVPHDGRRSYLPSCTNATVEAGVHGSLRVRVMGDGAVLGQHR